jgi:hypothetical protein
VTSAPPSGPRRSGNSFSLQVTSVTRTRPPRMAASRAPHTSPHLHMFFAPSSGAIHKWMTTSCNLFLTSCSVLLCSGTRISAPRGTTPPPAVNVVPSDSQVTSHSVSELHRGRGRFRDPFPASDDDQDAGLGGSTALGTSRSPIRVARKRKRQSPASVKDPETQDSEDGAIRLQKRAALRTTCNLRVVRKPSHKLERQPPAGSIVKGHGGR